MGRNLFSCYGDCGSIVDGNWEDFGSCSTCDKEYCCSCAEENLFDISRNVIWDSDCRNNFYCSGCHPDLKIEREAQALKMQEECKAKEEERMKNLKYTENLFNFALHLLKMTKEELEKEFVATEYLNNSAKEIWLELKSEL